MQDFTKKGPILTLYPEAHLFRKECRSQRKQKAEQKCQRDAPGC